MDAQAWSQGDSNGGLHHYLPGYGLSGALFMHILPWQPFLIPDLISYIACLGFFCLIARCLVPDHVVWRFAAPLIFGASTLGTATLRSVWLVPWSTTGSAPFQFAALLAAVYAARAPSFRRMAVLGAALGACAGFRPADAAVLLVCCTGYVAYETQREFAVLWRHLVALGVGLLAGALPWLAVHVAAHGLSLGAYLGRMSAVGFEWRLLALRWVQIGIDARPVLADGPGILGAYPWVAVGIAGALFGAIFRGPTRSAWRLIAASIALHWMLYLCYRDLYAEGLWRYFNVHYFKWSFPFLALAAVRLCWALVQVKERKMALASVGGLLVLMLWRPALRIDTSSGTGDAAHPAIQTDLSSLDNATVLPISGLWQSIYFSNSDLTGNGVTFRSQIDFKLLPYRNGALLIPLRELAGPPLALGLGSKLTWRPGEEAHSAVQEIRFGLPCFLLKHIHACDSNAESVFFF